jgi:hypothetical protein
VLQVLTQEKECHHHSHGVILILLKINKLVLLSQLVIQVMVLSNDLCIQVNIKLYFFNI